MYVHALHMNMRVEQAGTHAYVYMQFSLLALLLGWLRTCLALFRPRR